MDNEYLHGFTPRERQRLYHGALTLTKLLQFDRLYLSGHKVPVAGRGAGAQTKTPARHSPGARFVSVDIWE